ncbi:baseplate assembly protein [Chromobacterium vaccinii]|uniref:baseplate assembly protein n=1 Tax=Chromobacterium vaccinii TaxID=1108595 RepID=UPI003C7905A9
MGAINLSALPPPDVVETLDFEVVLADICATLLRVAPADMRAGIAAALKSELEPIQMLAQVAAYRELLLRQRVNEAARATLLAYAEKADLDNRAADYGVTRLLVRPADPNANPPTSAEYENDERLRYRCQMALEGLAAAGPRGAYRFHALSASVDVADVDIDTPEGGLVRVWVLARDGVARQPLLAQVAAALNAETIRPLCDAVEVVAATPLDFSLQASIVYLPGGEKISGGLEGARERLATMLAARRSIRGSVPRSAIDAALHVPGVDRVAILAPAADVMSQPGQYPDCSSIMVSAS